MGGPSLENGMTMIRRQSREENEEEEEGGK
jgi:hypothetical protein